MSTSQTNLAAEVIRLVGAHPGIDRKGLMALFPETLADELDLTAKRLACCLGNQITARRLTRSATGGYTVRPNAKPVRKVNGRTTGVGTGGAAVRPDPFGDRRQQPETGSTPAEDGRQPAAGRAPAEDGQQPSAAGTTEVGTGGAADRPDPLEDERQQPETGSAAAAEPLEDNISLALRALSYHAHRALTHYVRGTDDKTLHALLGAVASADAAEVAYLDSRT